MKNALLEQELTGTAPVLVKLGAKKYPLAYPLHAVLLYKSETLKIERDRAVDEESRAKAKGDNLFQTNTWNKIGPDDDPERFLACLWVGLHQEQPDHTWLPELSKEEICSLADFSNAPDIVLAITKALLSYFPEEKKEAASPNEQTPATETIPRPAKTEAAD